MSPKRTKCSGYCHIVREALGLVNTGISELVMRLRMENAALEPVKWIWKRTFTLNPLGFLIQHDDNLNGK